LRSPVERVNRDRLQVTRDSSEGVEEMIWLRFFDQLHDSSRSNVLGDSTLNSDFETFFKDHIRKLLLVRGRSRYVSKNNPCVTRMRYLRRIFPDARFLLYVRNPIDHAASVLKQDRLFSDLARDDRRLVRMNKMTGFHEFGPNYVPVNVGNDAITQEICRCRDEGPAPIVNSLEAMKDVDGIREMVIQSQQAEDEQILVSVSDTGIGLPPRLAEQIFGPFFTN
jgi:sulfotransferase family protein